MNASSQRPGYIALLSILIVASLAASTVLVLFITSLNTALNSADVSAGKTAKAAAEACAELALQRLSSGLAIPCSSCPVLYTLSTTPLYQCTISSISGLDGAAPNGWTIRAKASAGTITKYLEISATRSAPGSAAMLRSWNECLNFSSSPCPKP